ncbi:MAG TPA: efflux RND transporter permease subunit [Chitinophagaceae bacterium]|nr:efflux RND transporter permease subunit [Chitinophagaceae bacterium]
MKKLTELAIKRPLLIVVIFFVLLFFGIFCYSKLNYNLLPKMDFPVVSIVTTYRGASAQEIENTVTKKIEDAVSSMEGIKKINSKSLEGASMVIVQFQNGTNVDKSQTEAQQKVNQILSILPEDVDAPIINKFSSEDLPIIRMSVTAKENDKKLYDLLDQQIKPQLSNIEGVGRVSLIGANERRIRVKVNRDKLNYYGISIAQVSSVITAASLSTPAGKIQTQDNEYAIEFDSKFTSASQLSDLIIQRSQDGGKIYLRDVAAVMNSQEEPSTINHIDGLPAIGVQIQKQTDANAVEVSEHIKKRIKDLTQQYQDIGLTFKIATDQSTYTLESANAVMDDLLLAVLIVSVVMLFFLHSLRNATFVLVALPASIIPTFIGMYLFGMSLNLMTLMAMSLVVGILVDDSIVILENINRHMEMGKNKRRATVDGRYEIGYTAMCITLVDVVVFLPMSMVSGMIGNIIREFSLTVVFSTLMSLIVCFTLTPLLASRWGKIANLKKKNAWSRMNLWFENQITKVRNIYTAGLRWSLFHKRWVFIVTILLLVGSICLPVFGFIGGAFISQGDKGEFIMTLELDPSASLYKTNQVTHKAENIIMQNPEVETVFSNVGVSGSQMAGSSSSNMAQIDVKLTNQNERSKSDIEIGEIMQNKISKIPGVKATVAPVSIVGGADQAPIQLIVRGSNRNKIRKAADKIMVAVKSTAGVVYPDFSTKTPKPQIRIALNREKMSTFGLNAQTVGAALGTAFRGNNQAKYKYKGNEYDIMVEVNDVDKTKTEDIKNLLFTNPQGQQFTLDQFANITETMGESILERSNRLPSITVQANVQGRPTGTVGDEIANKIEQLPLPEGISWGFSGEIENQEDAFGSLLAALGIGILLVYLIMTALYDNAIYPLVVMMAMPLAIIGAFLALALTMNELTVFSIIGIIMLIGLVTKNGILLVDFTNQRKTEGATLVEALVDAGRERFRPILMTTIAMIVGMLPLALASGAGSEVKSGMAWVIIGGLTSSLIMTLIVVPCFYYIVDSMLNVFRKKRRNKMVQKVINRQKELA